MIEKLLFSKHSDDCVTIETPWHQRIEITDQFLADARRDLVRVEGDLVTLTVANGFGQYIKVGYREAERVGVYELLASRTSRTVPLP